MAASPGVEVGAEVFRDGTASRHTQQRDFKKWDAESVVSSLALTGPNSTSALSNLPKRSFAPALGLLILQVSVTSPLFPPLPTTGTAMI